jgi:hypothetical protein
MCDDGDGLLNKSRLLDGNCKDCRSRPKAAALAAIRAGGDARDQEHDHPDDKPRDGTTVSVTAAAIAPCTTCRLAAYITPAFGLDPESSTVSVIHVVSRATGVNSASIRFTHITEGASRGSISTDE